MGTTSGGVPYESGEDVRVGSGVTLTRGAVPYERGDTVTAGSQRLGTASLVCAVPVCPNATTGWGAVEGRRDGTEVLGAPRLTLPAFCMRG